LNGYSNLSFVVNDVGQPFSWKRLLRGDGGKRGILQQLFDHPSFGRPLDAHLDAIISAAGGLEPWREALVKNADAILYCKMKNIQREGDYVILLSRERRSAPHAELFTFLLDRRLQPPLPFVKAPYHDRYEPHIPLLFKWGEHELALDIYADEGDFALWMRPPVPPDLHALLYESAGFTIGASEGQLGCISRAVAPHDLATTLGQIAALLTAS